MKTRLLVTAILLLALKARHAAADHAYVIPAQGDAYLRLELLANLSKNSAFEPVSLSPDVHFGVSDNLAIGIVHSSFGITGVAGGVGSAICLTGESKGCADVYPGGAVDVRWQLVNDDSLGFAINTGLVARGTDPFALAGKLGFVTRHNIGQSYLELNPNVLIGFNERDAGNKELLSVPLNFIFGHKPLSFMVQAAIVGPFEDLGDFYRFAMAAQFTYWLTARAGLGFSLSLPAIIAGDGIGGDGIDARTGALLFVFDF